ncbi:hypothetical protein K435DRAFT_808525 [Dendrothele bispora CBS 962.96]|uniref:Chromatin elongation factor spt5 n=1 Tax=Dendrothele bispora (strain CBS 962.96) TaxID=1314807 RepID=A0A4S8L1J0_DENBC|nr:hypothetical protein K435DRAFT_808525 [Dendrothele bispora CBS 962.96]
MPNPFIDVEAQVDNEEDIIEPLFLPGSDDEDDFWARSDDGETGNQSVKDENAPSPLIGDETLSNNSLRAALLSTDVATEIFWRVKCKPGHESDLVSDIMRRELGCASVDTPEMPATYNFESVPPAEVRAFEVLCKACVDPSASIPETEAELKKILASAYNALWEQAPNVSSPQDPDEDHSVALERLSAMQGQLVTTLLSPATNPPSCPSQAPAAPAPPPSLLRSAFFVPTVLGFIYLEADLGLRPQDTDIINYLRGHKAVYKRPQRTGETSFAQKPWLTKSLVWLERVPCGEIATVLETSTSTIRKYSWVRVTRGEYAGDVGLVWARQTSAAQRRLVILLVPRLPPRPSCASSDPERKEVKDSKKRKREREKYPQALFDPKAYSVSVSDEAHAYFIYNGKEYLHGLHCKSLDYHSVTQVDVDMDATTRRLFRASTLPTRFNHLPIPTNWTFFYQDKVEVICSAPLNESQKQNLDLPRQAMTKYAVVTAVDGDYCKVQFADYEGIDENDTADWISKLNLQKRIFKGDSVEDSRDVHDFFWVEANECRTTRIRESDAVPWLGHLVTVIKGPYRRYQGIVVDVHPPRPSFTSLDIRIPELVLTVPVNHDDVYDSCSYQYLRTVAPLTPQQKHFQQAMWEMEFAPNLKVAVYDKHERRYLTTNDMVIPQPPQPWIGNEVRVVTSIWKCLGIVKQVERSARSVSGLRLQVELQFISAVHSIPVQWFDYGEVYDPRTGDSLTIAYPLAGHQKRYWRPLIPPRHIRPDKQPMPIPEWSRPPRPLTPPWNSGPFFDPFASAEPSAGPGTSSLAQTHWTLNPRLVGRKFYARWGPTHDLPMEKVLVEPVEDKLIKVYSGAEVLIGRSHEIYDCAVRISPTTNKRPLLGVHREHTGKYMHQIYYKYDCEGKPVIIAAVFRNWGSSNEEYVETIEVQPEDLAETSNDWRHDPNEKRFASLMKTMRDQARKTRPHKPKAKD